VNHVLQIAPCARFELEFERFYVSGVPNAQKWRRPSSEQATAYHRAIAKSRQPRLFSFVTRESKPLSLYFAYDIHNLST
jgi:hypothetical protein